MGLAGKIKNSGSDASAGAGAAAAAAPPPPGAATNYNGYNPQQQQPNGAQYGRFSPSAPPFNTTASSNAAAPPPAYNNGGQSYPAAAAAPPSNYAQPYNAGAPPPAHHHHHQSHLKFDNPPLGYPPISQPPPPHNSQQPYPAAAASAQYSHSYSSSAQHSQQYASALPSQPYGAPPPANNDNYRQSQLPAYNQPPPASAAAPPYQQNLYLQISSTPSNTMDLLNQKLQSIIQRNGLQRFYDPPRLQSVLHKVASINFADIAAQWNIGRELAYDLAPLALYDIVFYCDDSGSMAFEENGERINDLKFILSKVSNIATMFDDDGIIVRFMNSNVNGDGVRNAADVANLISQVQFNGATPLGTNFDHKVIQPFVIGQATSYNNAASMAKPVLAIVITDGEPYGEARDTIMQVIRRAKDTLMRSPYGSGALAVQIAQVGKDAATQKFLESLDKDPIVGGMIDCTSYYEMEEQEFARKGVTLTPELWLLKMCVGAIDPEYDSKDD